MSGPPVDRERPHVVVSWRLVAGALRPLRGAVPSHRSQAKTSFTVDRPKRASIGLKRASKGFEKASMGLKRASIGQKRASIGFNKASIWLKRASIGFNHS